jgi:hypothetical protein
VHEFPFVEKQVGDKLFLREFKHDIHSEELIWHQDKEDRTITVMEANGWLLQLDNQVPAFLKEGEKYYIPKFTWHRVIKGTGDLRILLEKVY